MTDLFDVNTDDVSPTTGENLQADDTNSTRVMKRNRTTMLASPANESDEGEPNEKRPAFRLQPPTLVHGQAKPVGKSEEDKTSNVSKYKFLQPPKLSAPSRLTTSAPEPNQADITDNSKRLISSNNPFLKTVKARTNGEPQESDDKCDDQSERKVSLENDPESLAAMNGSGSSEDAQPDDTNRVKPNEKDAVESKPGNPFLQTTSPNANSGPVGNFVFGSKMEDRVALSNDTTSSSKDSGDGRAGTSGFVFGQNFSDRAKVSSSIDGRSSLFLPPSSSDSVASGSNPGSSSADEHANVSPASTSEEKRLQGLKEDAAAHFLASQTKPVMPEVDVVTGEEDERNVLQVLCKLHQFEASTQNWVERAVGNLRLNDGKSSEDKLRFQSRLVIRAHGSLRLVLNTKIWAQMTVERGSKKAIRITAQTEEGGIGVFLITCTIKDAEQVFRALEYRVLHQKQLEEKISAIEKEKECERGKDDVANADDAGRVNSDQDTRDEKSRATEVESSKATPLVNDDEQQQSCNDHGCSSSLDSESKKPCENSSSSDSTACISSDNSALQSTNSKP